jgi:DNA-binding LacI/PurR family transcriptional regulator
MPRRSTIKDVAQAAGVSYQTVSKVFNRQVHVTPETEARIWRAIRELDYHPSQVARSLRSQASHAIGYSPVPIQTDQINPILDRFLQSMLSAAEPLGYSLLTFLHHPQRDEQLAVYQALIESGRVDGFVVTTIEYDDPRIRLLEQNHFPFIAFGRANPGWNFPCVDIDGGLGIELAAKHLVEMGHTRIACLGWSSESRVGNNRMEGYRSALAAAGLEPREELVMRGEGRVAFGYHATHTLLNLPADQRPTAVIAFNDSMAFGAMHAAHDRGLHIGVDLAITGFDDSSASQYIIPPLTSIHQPFWEAGQYAIHALLAGLQSGRPPQPQLTLLAPHLVIRESSTGVRAPLPLQ